MFRANSTFPFISIAGLLLAANCLSAADDNTSVISVNTTVINLNSGSPNYEIETSATLSANQTVDGVYGGTISGAGTLKKLGNGNLDFSGKFDNFGGYVDLAEGVLTIGSGAAISGSEVEIKNSAVLVLNQSGVFDGKLIRITGDTGAVESNGSGTTTIGTSTGATLDVRAGTLVIDGIATFGAMRIGDYAELRIGTGNANNGLKGDINVASTGTLRFNRVSTSDNPLIYDGAISGSGSVVFDGEAEIQFTGEKHEHTGEITVNAGTLLFINEKQVELSSSKITVNGGAIGGNAKVAGSLEVKGKYIPASSTGTELGGALFLGVAGANLTIGGDLTFDPLQVELVTDSEGAQTIRIADYGGVMQVSLSNSGCGSVEVLGKTTLAGTLILSGADSLVPGQVKVFLRATGGLEGNFDFVDVSSDNVMLVTSGVRGVGANELGIAAIENRYLRKRAAFQQHDGISNFVDLAASWTESRSPNEVAQAINLAMGNDIARTVNNFSPLAHSALPGMGVRQSNLEVDYLRRAFVPGLKSPASPDGIRVPANIQYFSTFLSETVDHRDSATSPIYDSTSFGVMAGMYSWIDEERLAGSTISVHRGSAQTHGYDRGTLVDNSVRLRAFVGFMPKNSDWSLLFGVSAAGHYYDLDRETDTGTNKADEFGMEAGFFAAWNFQDEIGNGYFFTPYARMDFNYVRVDTVRETGSASALEVDAFGYASFRFRLGSGVEKKISKSIHEELTLGCDFGLVAELGRDPEITSRFTNYSNSTTSIRGIVEDRVSFEFTPRLSCKIDEHWSVDATYNFQFTVDGSSSRAFTLGVRTTF